MRMATFLLLCLLSFDLLATDCPKYLVEEGVLKPTSLDGKSFEVRDLSHIANEGISYSMPELKVFKLDDVFSEAVPFLGFGVPNVYLTLPRNIKKFKKVAAKSMKRAPTEIQEMTRAQSGLLMVFPELPDDAIKALEESAQKHKGTKRWTCVNANCRIMQDAGFSFGNKSEQTLDQYYFPTSLLKKILHDGLEFQGNPVQYEFIRTTKELVFDFGQKIDDAVTNAHKRHAKRFFTGMFGENKVIANIYYIGKKIMVYFTDKAYGTKEIVPSKEPIILAPKGPVYKNDLNLKVGEPSNFGRLFQRFWNPHTIYQIQQNRVDINKFLPNVKNEFPGEKPDFITRLKKNILFSQPVVNLIRKHMLDDMAEISKAPKSTKNVFDMLRTHTDDTPNMYNIVITGEKILISKIDIKTKEVDWVLSKHVLISGYSDDVRFAGEIWKDAEGYLNINNNSGTYMPNNEELEQALKYFQEIAPNLKIRAHSL